MAPGICKDNAPGGGPPWMGLTFGEGGMARPSLGVRGAPFCRPPGMGGRRRGAGEDILGTWMGSKVFEGCRTSSACCSLPAVGGRGASALPVNMALAGQTHRRVLALGRDRCRPFPRRRRDLAWAAPSVLPAPRDRGRCRRDGRRSVGPDPRRDAVAAAEALRPLRTRTRTRTHV
jgi:hypothetical protein